jgi:putative nucleotidyltransferase with HDIG domain
MKCPGQDTRFWKPEAIFEVPCPKCGRMIEFFKDESTRRCKHCGHKVINPRMDFGCAAYCQFAAQCLGDADIIGQRDELFKSRVALEMKNYFHRDFKRIGHAVKVARYAEQIARQEKADLAIVLSAAYLHDIGLKEAERKYRSTAAKYQEREGPAIARGILAKLGAKKELIDEVSDIVGHHHHPRPLETANFKALYDADLITNLEESQKDHPLEKMEKKKIAAIIDHEFLTQSGRELAKNVLLKAEVKNNESKTKDN